MDGEQIIGTTEGFHKVMTTVTSRKIVEIEKQCHLKWGEYIRATPFSKTGVDLLGPYLITIGRKTFK